MLKISRYNGAVNYALTLFVIFGFVLIAVFGFVSMSHGSGHEKCIAVTASRINCPEKLGALGNAVFHADVFKKFSTAILSERILSASLFFCLLMLAALFADGVSNVLTREPFFAVFLKRIRLMHIAIPRSKFISWLSLFENSPTRF